MVLSCYLSALRVKGVVWPYVNDLMKNNLCLEENRPKHILHFTISTILNPSLLNGHCDKCICHRLCGVLEINHCMDIA